MIIESLNEYLEALSGYIHDDDKLVTYKWLSKELEVHVNVAKQILWKFWQNHHEENKIESTIMLMGFLKDGGMRVEVVKQSNLSAAKEKFKEIISEHIYSVQKALPDISLLAISGEGDVRYSAIKCEKCVERNEEELSLLRWGAASKDHIEADEKEAKAVKKAEDTRKASDVNAQHKSTEEKPLTTKKSPGSQQAGLGNFFGKSAQKQKSPSLSAKTESHGASSKTSQNKKESPKETKKSTLLQKKGPKSGITSFFNKNVQKEEEKKESTSVPPENSKPASYEPQKREQSPVKKQVKGKKTPRGVKRVRSKEEDTVKKRKRIIIEENSSDTDPFVSDVEELNATPSPERVSAPKAKSPTPPLVKHEGGKRRVLKIVDKTFQDEDGYLVTQKVHVYESCSEDEPEIVKVKPVEKPDHIESKNKKKKQATLMSFFKK